jgi:hypothetical protein
MKFHTIPYATDDVAPGKYKGKFMGCSDLIAMEHGDGIFWTFEVEKGGELLTVTGVTSKSFALDPRCKARRWAEAIDPHFEPVSIDWESEECIGFPCLIDVIYYDGADGLRSTVKEVSKWENPPSAPKSDVS